MAPPDEDRVADAIDELYSLDPGEFTERRNALATAARKANAATAGKQILALRKPTRAAWILNQLARAEPDLVAEFAALGQQLRTAHLSLDGDQIRELSRQRRLLIDQTAAQAFTAAGVDAPPAGLRDDVTATLGAVLADDDAAARFAAGTLVTAEDQSGFGPTGAQLRAVPSPRDETATGPARPSAREAREAAKREAALIKAEHEVETAQAAKAGADDAATEAAHVARRLTDQLADAKRREDDALLAARHADLQLQKARKALDGLLR
jgi:hypothetical protein